MHRFLALLAFATAASPALAFEWSSPPAACLPDRSERWDDFDEAEPCHCPPQEFCPPTLDLRARDINIVVVADGRQSVAPSTGLLGVSPDATYAEVEARLREHANTFNRTVRHSRPVNYEGRSVSKTYEFWPFFDEEAIEAWFRRFRMPELLVNQCCDSFCPVGTMLVKEEVRVPKAEFGVDAESSEFTAEDIWASLNPIDNCMQQLQTEQEAAEDDPDSDVEILDPDEMLAFCEEQVVEPETEIRTRYRCEGRHIVAQTREVWPREGCLRAGTMISLADGREVAIETLQIGDLVMGNHGPAPVKAISRFTQELDAMYALNGGEAFFTVEHPILTPEGWKAIDSTVTSAKSGVTIVGDLEVGDTVLLENGREMVIETIEREEVGADVSAYNLSVGGDGSIVANDIVMKGFHQMQMHY